MIAYKFKNEYNMGHLKLKSVSSSHRSCNDMSMRAEISAAIFKATPQLLPRAGENNILTHVDSH